MTAFPEDPPAFPPMAAEQPPEFGQITQQLAALSNKLDGLEPEASKANVEAMRNHLEAVAKMLSSPTWSAGESGVARRLEAAVTRLQDATEAARAVLVLSADTVAARPSSAPSATASPPGDAKMVPKQIFYGLVALPVLALIIGLVAGIGIRPARPPEVTRQEVAALAQQIDDKNRQLAGYRSMVDSIRTAGNKLEWFYDCPTPNQHPTDKRWCLFQRTQRFTVPQ